MSQWRYFITWSGFLLLFHSCVANIVNGNGRIKWRPGNEAWLFELTDLQWKVRAASPSHLILNSTMATSGRENFNPAYETFRKHSAGLLTIIQDPEVLAWELFSKSVISCTGWVHNNMTHERATRTSNLLMAVGSQIEVDPGVFDTFLSVLTKWPSMS